MNLPKVITRFPPSPTGFLHVGRARTALFNYLFTKQKNGKMVFRIEDTDKERSKVEFEQNIIDCLSWLNIKYDEGPYRQSERLEIYKKYLKQLVDNKSAYISKEIPKEEGDREEVIRFKNPNKKIIFEDLIRGTIEFDTTDLGDFVIAKSLDEPIYHLAVVIDDFEMGVTHIIRGEDGISNTPRQILIQEAIGATRPFYAHVPLILAPDKSKLSGRHGAVSVTDFKNEGYLPEAMINFLALIGWNPGTNQEIFSMEELLEQFDISKIQKSGGVFNIEKLDWINKEYIKKMSEQDYLSKTAEFLPESIKKIDGYTDDKFLKVAKLIRDRINKFCEVKHMAEAGDLDYFFEQPKYTKELLKDPMHLLGVIDLLLKLPENNFSADKIKSTIWELATEKGRGLVLWPMRVALSGKEKSPDPFILAETLGKEETIRRLNYALNL